MSDHPAADDLARIPLLSGLPEEALDVLAERFDTERFDAGHRFVAEGRAGYAFYVIDRGRASVTQDGREIRSLGPGDFFGEIAIMGTGRRTATVTATEPGEVWTLFGTSFREMQSARPDVAEALSAAMADRLAASPSER